MSNHQNYLITGSNGLVGSALKDILHKEKQTDNIFLTSKDADLTKFDDCMSVLMQHKPKRVIHLAANVGGLYKNMSSNVQIYEDNLLINTNLIKACFKNNVKQFVGCLSTCIFPKEVTYPINESQLFIGEPHESNYGYAYAKRMMEIQCRAYRQQYGVDYRCVIPTNIYGPNDNFSLSDGHVIPALIHKIYLAKKYKEKNIIIYGSGKPLRQFIYSHDLANILLKLNNVFYKDPIIIADTQEYSISSVVDIIVNKLEYEGDILYDTTKSDGQYKKTADNSQMNRYVDFDFTTLEDGLSKTIDWFVDAMEVGMVRT